MHRIVIGTHKGQLRYGPFIGLQDTMGLPQSHIYQHTQRNTQDATFKSIAALAATSLLFVNSCSMNSATDSDLTDNNYEKRQLSAELRDIRAEKTRLLQMLAEKQESEYPDAIAKTNETPFQSGSIYTEIDRLQSIRNPNDRIRANTDFVKGLMGSFDQVIRDNPQATGGLNPDEFLLESLYNRAREEGLPPSEAQIEAQREFRNMKRFMNQ